MRAGEGVHWPRRSSVHTRVASPLDRWFFPLIALTAVASVAAGFAPTYYLGHWFRAPPLTTTVHVHAAAFTAWLVLLLSQTLLIRARKLRWHRTMGKAAVAVVAVMVVTGYLVIVGKPRPTAATRAFIFTPMLSLALFPAMFAAAIHFRRDPATHKRLMILATIMIARAGFSRLMHMVGLETTNYRSDAGTYLFLLVPLLAFDLARLGTLHPATMWGSVLLLIRHPLHAAIAYSDWWQRLAAWLTPPT
jgi:hypothetical protein